jgi:hypothetical protein
MKHITLLLLLVAISLAQQAPETFVVQFDTTVNNGAGSILLNVTRSWAPIGVDRFYQLLTQVQYYNENGFFRVVPGFVGKLLHNTIILNLIKFNSE